MLFDKCCTTTAENALRVTCRGRASWKNLYTWERLQDPQQKWKAPITQKGKMQNINTSTLTSVKLNKWLSNHKILNHCNAIQVCKLCHLLRLIKNVQWKHPRVMPEKSVRKTGQAENLISLHM